MTRLLHTAIGSREDRRESLGSSPVTGSLGVPAREVEDLVERVCHRHGGAKSLAGGKLDKAYTTIRKWAGNGDLPGLRDLLQLIRLAGPQDPFRVALIAHLEHLFDPGPVDPAWIGRTVRKRLLPRGETIARDVEAVVLEVLGVAVAADPETVRRVSGRGEFGDD